MKDPIKNNIHPFKIKGTYFILKFEDCEVFRGPGLVPAPPT